MKGQGMPKALMAEGWYGPGTTVYYIEFRVRRLREKLHAEPNGRALPVLPVSISAELT
jgi:hypothetical protein